MRANVVGHTVLSGIFAGALLLVSCAGTWDVVVEPAGTDATLKNPHRGFTSTHQFNDDIGDRLHPWCGVVQYRWYWDRIEPGEDAYNFALIDSVLERCRENGQKLNFRIMCQNGGPHVPQWVRDAGATGEPYSNNPDNWQPHYGNRVFLEKHADLIRDLGARYDGHPDMNSMDIGTVGRWGEWHTGGTGMEMPDDRVRREIVDMYLESFRQTPLVMLIGGGSGLTYAVGEGAGWRADCLGDMGGFNPDWNHMEDMYPVAIEESSAGEAWKRAPVIFETCWTMERWFEEGWDIDHILQKALDWHVSSLNNATEAVPEPWWDKVVEFEKKMGYRFALRRLVHPNRLKPGGSMLYEMDWENEGVAPIYHNYPPAFRFRNAETGESRVVDLGIDITGWLPGTIPLQSMVTVPDDLEPGEYELGIALLDPFTGEPGIELAIEGRGADGWYGLSSITVE